MMHAKTFLSKDEKIILNIIEKKKHMFMFWGSGCSLLYSKKIHEARFESSIEWIFYQHFNKPKPKIVYVENANFLKNSKRIIDESTHHVKLGAYLRNEAINSENYEKLKSEYNYDHLIKRSLSFKPTPFDKKSVMFDVFEQVASMFYEMEENSVNLALLSRDLFYYTVYNAFSYHLFDSQKDHRGDQHLDILFEPLLEYLRDLCNTDVFHVFFRGDTVYALRYPSTYCSYKHRDSILYADHGSLNSLITGRPYFFWPYGHKIYASPDGLLPNWMFEEYMQPHYFNKFMDVSNEKLRRNIAILIYHSEGGTGLRRFLKKGYGDDAIAEHYYRKYIV